MSRDSTGARARFLAAIEKLPEVADGPVRLCVACVLALPVQRAGIATSLSAGGLEVLAASDEVAAGVEWAQVMVGEGPGVDAVLGGGPVSVPNLAYPDGRWPIFLSEIADSGVGAMFALPLQLGAIKVGVLDLYCDAAGRMGAADFADAVAVADLVTAILLTVGRDGRIVAPLGPWWDQPLSTREVHQATGMIMAQLGVDAQVAYARLQGFAFASRRLLHDVAHDVVERILRFDTGPGLGRIGLGGMSGMDSYEQLASAFVGLADTLVADYDVIELAQQLIDSSMSLLPIAAAGILVGDVQGELHVIASSSEQTRLLELLQVESDVGPCLLAYRTGKQVLVDDLDVDQQRWPAFAERAESYRYRSVSALPLRLREERVGALNLFRTEVGALSATHLAIGQALADVAAVGILNQRIMSRSELVNQQLQSALNTRVIIEQAKGVLAERGSVDMDRAFELLRSHARRTHQRLADVALAVVQNADTTAILNPDGK